MQYKTELNAICLSAQELEALGKEYGAERNILSQYPGVDFSQSEQTQVVAQFKQFPEPVQADFLRALATFGMPCQTSLFYEVMGKDFTTSLLVWPENDKDTLAQVTDTGEHLYLRCPRLGELSYFLQRNLVVDRHLISANLNVSFSPDAVLALLALVDASRYAEMDSMLIHIPPSETISLDDIMDRIQDSQVDDYRWNLNLLQKALPLNITEEMNSQRVASAMKELLNVGLVELLDEGEETPDGNLPPVYRFSASGQLVQNAFLESVTLELFGIGREIDSRVDYEIKLLVRGEEHLFMILWSTTEGGLYSLSPATFETFLQENQLGSLYQATSSVGDEEEATVEVEVLEEGDENGGN